METDPIEALVAFLKADSAVAAILGARVFGGELDRREVQSMPRACAVLSPAGGGLIGLEYQNYGDLRVDVDCYAATVQGSWTLYRAVYGALKEMKREIFADTLLHWAKPSSRGTTGRDPLTDWPMTISSWQVLAAEVAVA